MNRSIRKKAFTLIELLVVIAIIAILAAILFPVFAQAKKAAKQTVGISNMKQIGLSLHMYANDFDDTSPNRRIPVTDAGGTYYLSWKAVDYPYVKNAGVFTDPINPASKFADDTSNFGYAQVMDGATEDLPAGVPRFTRGYAMVNNFWLTGNWGGPGVNESQVPEVAKIMQTFETASVFVDAGPYLPLCNGSANDANNGCTGQENNESAGGTIPITWTTAQPNFGGLKTKGPKGHASLISYYDGHAGILPLGGFCNNDPTQLNTWGYTPSLLNGGYLGGAQITWMDSWCNEARQDGE